MRGYVVFTLAVLVALMLAWMLRHVLEIVFVSALFAVVLTPTITRVMAVRVAGRRPSRTVAILLLAGGIVLALALFFWIGLPPVLSDGQHAVHDLPSQLPIIAAKIKQLPLANKFGVDQLTAKAGNVASASAAYVFSKLPEWAGHVLDIVTALFLCLYFMIEGDRAYAYFLSFFRPEPRQRLDRTLRVAEQRMSKWLLGQLSLMLILGVYSTTVFGLLHVRYFVLLGVLMGLFNIIPVAGGLITIVLAAGVAALDSWTKMGLVLLFYVIYIQIENGILTPRIMKSSVDLLGLTILIALLVGTALAGIVGALVSVPTAALVAVLMDEYLVQKDPPAQQLAGQPGAPTG